MTGSWGGPPGGGGISEAENGKKMAWPRDMKTKTHFSGSHCAQVLSCIPGTHHSTLYFEVYEASTSQVREQAIRMVSNFSKVTRLMWVTHGI